MTAITNGPSTILVEQFDEPGPGYVKITIAENRSARSIRLGRLDAARLAAAILIAGGETGDPAADLDDHSEGS